MRSTALLTFGLAVALGCSKAPESGLRTGPVENRGKVGGKAASKDPHARAAKKAVTFLLTHQNADGGFGSFKGRPQSTVGVTALVCYALMKSPMKLTEASNPVVASAMRYIISKQQPSGAISDPALGLDNYTTSAGVMALKLAGNPAYEEAIEKARAYLLGLQLDEGEGLTEKDAFYGGAVYKPGGRASDASNTGMWMDAMHELGMDPDDPAMKKALLFMKRVQNNPEVNDMEWAKAVAPEDFGGGVYRPAKSPHRDDVDISKGGPRKLADGRTGWRSYGSMTYAMFKGFIYAGLKKDDPAVQAALDWIEKNYTLDENPGIGDEGRYYYYRVFARALSAFGEKTVAGRDWARDIADKLVALQSEDGSWVNAKDRWYEGDPVLVTAYALEALSIAMDELGRRE